MVKGNGAVEDAVSLGFGKTEDAPVSESFGVVMGIEVLLAEIPVLPAEMVGILLV